MSIYTIDWMSILSNDSVMKPDISFHFPDSDEPVETHKFIMSTLSPVFRAQFAGNFEESNKVEIEDTTKNVFEGMIQFFYDRNFSLENYKMEELFELLKLADRYDIPDLAKLITYAINDVNVTDDNVVEFVKIAKDYEVFAPFTEVSATTFKRCIHYILTTLKTAHEVYNFVATVRIDDPELEDNIKLLLLKTLSTFCPTCMCEKIKCLEGKKVFRKDLEVGRKLKATATTMSPRTPHTPFYIIPSTTNGYVAEVTDLFFTINWDIEEKTYPTKYFSLGEVSDMIYVCQLMEKSLESPDK